MANVEVIVDEIPGMEFARQSAIISKHTDRQTPSHEKNWNPGSVRVVRYIVVSMSMPTMPGLNTQLLILSLCFRRLVRTSS